MTMGPVEIERKVRQLDSDVQAIYEMLAAIEGTQRRHSHRFQELTEQIDRKFAAVDSKMDTLDFRMNTLDGKFVALDGKFASLDSKVASLDSKMDAVLELLRSGPPASA